MNFKILILAYLIFSLCSCNLFDRDLVPEDLITFERQYQLSYKNHTQASLFETEDGFLTFLSDGNVIRGLQFDYLSNFIGEYDVIFDQNLDDVLRIEDNYLLLSNTLGEAKLTEISSDFQIIKEKIDLKTFVDTSYNLIDSLIINDIHYNDEKKEILACGYFISFGFQFSFAMGFDKSLNPKWFVPHLTDGDNYTIKSQDDHYIIAGIKNDVHYLIKDDSLGQNFQKVNPRSFLDQGFLDVTIFNNEIFVTGSSQNSGIIMKFFDDLSASFTESFEQGDSKGFISIMNHNGNMVTAGFFDFSNQVAMMETYRWQQGTEWCNSYSATSNEIPLSILEVDNCSYILLSLASNDGVSYWPRLIKTDAEGATRQSPFNGNCGL